MTFGFIDGKNFTVSECSVVCVGLACVEWQVLYRGRCVHRCNNHRNNIYKTPSITDGYTARWSPQTVVFLERRRHIGWLQGQAARPTPLPRLALQRGVGLRLPMFIRHGWQDSDIISRAVAPASACEPLGCQLCGDLQHPGDLHVAAVRALRAAVLALQPDKAQPSGRLPRV
ncbi:hypothetical protein PybrP1_008406 [[Pythium] brassicae (nom. inval.)]|nr:hypothetical protein PybrP1_008406 [[Pythium] brassicae (nom. inval.)]